MRNKPVQILLRPAPAPTSGETPAPGTRNAPGGAPPAVIFYRPGESLARSIYLSGLFQAPALCSGLGLCGRCRVRVLRPALSPLPDEERFFPPSLLELGWRLACRRFPVPGMLLELPSWVRPFPDSAAAFADNPEAAPKAPATAHTHYGLAVDLGTTSLHWELAGWDEGSRESSVLWRGSMLNPQMGAGSEVVSRLAEAATAPGLLRLQDLTLRALRAIVAEGEALLAQSPPREGVKSRGKSAGGGRIRSLCLAANPAMSAICLGLDAGALASAPYSLPTRGGEWAALPGLPRTWVAPQISPFVGGDIAAGYAWLTRSAGPAEPGGHYEPARPAEHGGPAVAGVPAERAKSEWPFLLADLGTNGEFLLAIAPDEALAASVALGPALEGIGLAHGTNARPGAIIDFSLGPRGLAASALENPEPSGEGRGEGRPGITGTGYLALLRLLLRSGAMNEEGRFTPERCLLPRFLTPLQNGAPRLPLPDGLFLYAADVEELLKAKAAFSLGLERLLDLAGLPFHSLKKIYVAGALGEHMRKTALTELGFFPPGLEDRITAVGNSSLAGAALLLRDKKARAALKLWAAGTRTLDLAGDAVFQRDFTSRMRFSWG